MLREVGPSRRCSPKCSAELSWEWGQTSVPLRNFQGMPHQNYQMQGAGDEFKRLWRSQMDAMSGSH